MNAHQFTRSSVTRAGAESGFALIEVMVGLLLFSIGILGLVGVQGAMTQSQTAAKFRADAAFLASEAIGTMWTDRANLNAYVTSPGTPCTATRCAAWVAKV